jgi:hypothetical protein
MNAQNGALRAPAAGPEKWHDEATGAEGRVERLDPPDPERGRGARREMQLGRDCDRIAAPLEVAYDDSFIVYADLVLADSAGGAVPRAPLRRLLMDEAIALSHAHAKNLVHGAIRPTALALATRDEPGRLTRGLWVKPGEGLPSARDGETIYRAPELVREGRLTSSADIYALGLAALAIGHGPGFEARVGFPADRDSAERMLLRGERLPIPPDLLAALGELAPLLSRMIDPIAEQRPTAAEIVAALSGRSRRPVMWGAGALAIVLIAALIVPFAARRPGRRAVAAIEPAVAPAASTPGRTVAKTSARPAPSPVGEVRVVDPGRPRLPGELAELDLKVILDEGQPADSARLWATYAGSGGEVTKSYPLDPDRDDLVADATEAAGLLEMPLIVSIGVGPDRERPAGRRDVRLRVGFWKPPGLSYPAGVPDRRDATPAHRWYATAIRDRDQAPVSVFRAPGGEGFWLVDQGTVSVGQYLTYLGGARPFLVGAIREAGELPPALATFAGRRLDPLRGVQPVEPRTPEHCAALLLDGPVFHDPDPPPYHLAYRGYPAPADYGDYPIVVDPAGLPGGTTDVLPCIGLGWVEMVAYAKAMGEAGAGWTVGDPRLAALLEDSGAEPAPAPRATLGDTATPFGIHFAAGRGNVLEPAGADGGGGPIRYIGHAFSGRVGTPARPILAGPFDRLPDASFRLALFVEDR